MSDAEFRAGFVALVGRPNVGKSTLLNALLGEKVSIVSPKPQTTRTRVHGILNRPHAQIVLVDTPGLSRGKSALQRMMRAVAGDAAADAELGLVVISADAGQPRVSDEDRELCERVRAQSHEVIVAINKVDQVHPKEQLLPWIELYARELEVAAVIPISAKKGDGLELLEAELTKRLPLSPALFPTDLHTTAAERFLCEELVREQLLRQTEQEVPHSACVVLDDFEDGRPEDGGPGGLVRLEGRIVVERDSQKAIVIGKGGARIKEVSQRARVDIEELLGCKVYLRLRVAVDKDWTDDHNALRRYGLDGTPR